MKQRRIATTAGSVLRPAVVILISLIVFGASARTSLAVPAPEVLVLLRESIGRDADLHSARIDLATLEQLERIADTRLVPLGVASDGAQILKLPTVDGARAIAEILSRLRAHRDVLYADIRPTAKRSATAFTGAAFVAEQRLDRIVVLFADPALRDLSDSGGSLPREKVSEIIGLAGLSLYVERPMSGGAWVLRLLQRMPASSVATAAARLQADASITWAEPAVRGRFQNLPNDPSFPEQWALTDREAGIDAPGAWEITTGSPEIIVAILDSGIRRKHPDLQARLLPGADFVSDKWRSGDLDPRDLDPEDPGDAARRGECSPSAAASSSTWHGTHVAGTIGAATDNREGIAGVDWHARLLPIRVGAKCGIDPIDLADAIRWAAGVGPKDNRTIPGPNPDAAHILNISIGFPGSCPAYMQAAINDALAAGALVVVAAGNDGQPAQDVYPASCHGVLSVYATDRRGRRTPYSNFGRVHLAAPGGSAGGWSADQILSTDNRGETRPTSDHYGYKVGTSMAAPHVAGVAALLLAANPELRPGQLINILMETARPFPAAGAGSCSSLGARSCGAGILDAAAAARRAKRSAAPQRD